MPKPKWNLNTIYISERLQESLRPISRCAMTTVVAPMGYGKTTAVNWYLGEHAKAETLHIIRISVYSDNLAIFWKSVPGGVCPRRVHLPAGVSLPNGRGRRRTAGGRSLPYAGGRIPLLHLH